MRMLYAARRSDGDGCTVIAHRITSYSVSGHKRLSSYFQDCHAQKHFSGMQNSSLLPLGQQICALTSTSYTATV